MKVLTTTGLTKLIQLIKSSFIKTTDTVETQETDLKTINGQSILGSGDITIDISSKQDATDNTLTTTDKTIVGAINEVNAKEVIIPEVLESISPLSSNTITLQKDKCIYSKTISSNTTFTFNTSSLGSLTNKAVTFELYLTMSTAYTLAFPNSVTWIAEPDFSKTGKYLLVFKSLDGGTSWLGNLEAQW